MNLRSLLTILSISFGFNQIEFTPHSLKIGEKGIISLHSIDLNEDGKIDLISASLESNSISWFENLGNQNFIHHHIADINGAVGVFPTDLNRDGETDIIAASMYDDTILWYQNDGNENFTEMIIIQNGDGPWSIFAGDIDGDGTIAFDYDDCYEDCLVQMQGDATNYYYYYDLDGDGIPGSNYGNICTAAGTEGSQTVTYVIDGSTVSVLTCGADGVLNGTCDDTLRDIDDNCNGCGEGTGACTENTSVFLYDACGVCNNYETQPSFPYGNCDCDGVSNGDAYFDICNHCVGGSTGFNECVIDCSGFENGDAYIDDCGECVGGNTNKDQCEQDCSGIWGGDDIATIDCPDGIKV